MVGTTLAETPKTNGTPQKFDPLAFFDTLEQEFEQFWRHPFFQGFGAWPLTISTSRAGKGMFVPRTDIYEKDGTFVITAELPGMKKEDVQVEVVDGDLVIKAKSAAEKEGKDAQYYRMERSYGAYYRRVPLPFQVPPDQITATLTDGVLEVSIPKPAATPPTTTKVPIS